MSEDDILGFSSYSTFQEQKNDKLFKLSIWESLISLFKVRHPKKHSSSVLEVGSFTGIIRETIVDKYYCSGVHQESFRFIATIRKSESSNWHKNSFHMDPRSFSTTRFYFRVCFSSDNSILNDKFSFGFLIENMPHLKETAKHRAINQKDLIDIMDDISFRYFNQFESSPLESMKSKINIKSFFGDVLENDSKTLKENDTQKNKENVVTLFKTCFSFRPAKTLIILIENTNILNFKVYDLTTGIIKNIRIPINLVVRKLTYFRQMLELGLHSQLGERLYKNYKNHLLLQNKEEQSIL